MNSSTITVHWHDDNQPVYSVNFQPNRAGEKSTRLATGGGDNNVRIWNLIFDDHSGRVVKSVEYLCTLPKHTQAVNVVRFDPKGEMLATAGDDGTVLIWTLADKIVRDFGVEDDGAKESWVVKHTCRSSTSEIYDLAWSPDSSYVITGCMDNISRIYSASSGDLVTQISDHNHYIQGVAWDPQNEFIATQSADRSVHIYSLGTNDSNNKPIQPTILQKISKAEFQLNRIPNHVGRDAISTGDEFQTSTLLTSPKKTAEASNISKISSIDLENGSASASASRAVKSTNTRNSLLYHNETLQSFFRRLTFSPDGSLLLTPTGIFKATNYSTEIDLGNIKGSSRDNIRCDDNDNTTNHSTSNDQNNSMNNESEELKNTVYVYTRAGLKHSPVLHLPGIKKPAIAISFSPLLYKLREETLLKVKYFQITSNKEISENSQDNSDNRSKEVSQMPVFSLPYRMIFAVATQDSILIYDTQQMHAIGIISNLHYSPFTDLSWNNDGKTLIISSTDGFCSAIVFDDELLGDVLVNDRKEISNRMLKEISGIEEKSARLKHNNEPNHKEAHTAPVEKKKLTVVSLLKEEKGEVEKKKRRIAPVFISDLKK